MRRLKEAVQSIGGGSADALGRMMGYDGGGGVRLVLTGKRPVTPAIVERIEAIDDGKYVGWFELPGELMSTTEVKKAWPFKTIKRADIAGLGDGELQAVEAAIRNELRHLRASLRKQDAA